MINGQAIKTISEDAVFPILPIKHKKKIQIYCGLLRNPGTSVLKHTQYIPVKLLYYQEEQWIFWVPALTPLGDLGQKRLRFCPALAAHSTSLCQANVTGACSPPCALLLCAVTATTTTDLPLEAFRKPRSQDPQEHLCYSPFPPAGNLLHSTFKTGKEKWQTVTACLVIYAKACLSYPSVVDFLACPLVAQCRQGLWRARGHQLQRDLHVPQGYPWEWLLSSF